MHTRPKAPWYRLIREGVPALHVIRRPLNIGDRVLQVGEEYPAPGDDKRKRVRARQYYQARRIGVVLAATEQAAATDQAAAATIEETKRKRVKNGTPEK